MCGENALLISCAPRTLGSPPRVRGKLKLYFWLFGSMRITPACAGKTSSRLFRIPYHWDHPRVCGENFLRLPLLCIFLGSPPRVRGKHRFTSIQHTSVRITPACAGKTYEMGKCDCECGDHPRVCGENLIYTVRTRANIGSPPRVRGKHFGNGVFPWLILVLSLDLL